MLIHCCSSPCGCGKTHQLINWACELAKQHKKVLVVQPTKELIDKTVNEELLARPDPPNYRVIHGGKFLGDKSVALELANYLKSSGDGGQIAMSHSLGDEVPRRFGYSNAFLAMEAAR